VVTEYILTDADVGFTFPERDGFLLSLVRSRGPYQDCHQRNWWERHFVLRDKTPRALWCLDAINFGRVPLRIGGAFYYAVNTCIQFTGALTLACVPSGSEWEVTLSDVYVQPLPSRHPSTAYGYAPNAMWGSVAGYRRPRLKQLALAAPPLMIAPPVTEPVIEPPQPRRRRRRTIEREA
jgi:hypothetical protein